ncbi:MAG: PTS sugar transporter subunit IIA [Candidatus Hodarchaeales archaeon]
MDIFIIKTNTKTKQEVVHELVNVLVTNGYIKPSYEEAIHTREKEFPTALQLEGEYNVAIPHAETEHVNKAAIALAILEQPILWENMEDPDEKIQVHLVFLLAITNPELVVPNLKAMTENIFSRPKVVEEIKTSTDFEQLKLMLGKLLNI